MFILIVVVSVLVLIAVYLWWKWMLLLLLAHNIRRIEKYKRKCYTNNVNYVKNPISFFTAGFTASFIRYIDIQTGLIPSFTIRDFIYKYIFLVGIRKNCTIHYGCEIRSHSLLTIGEGSIIGDRCLLDARNGINIGENVNIGSNVSIYTEQHDHSDPYFGSKSDYSYGVKIDDRVWIGPNVIILHSVHVGEGAVIGAGSIITKDVPPYAIMGGGKLQKLSDKGMII